MFSLIRKRFTYANVAMTLALVFAMTGGAYAAKHWVISSTKQIKPSVLKQLEGKQGPAGPEGKQGPAGTNGKDGVTGSQGEKGLQGEKGPQGVQGPAGPAGPEGKQGPAGTNGTDGKSVVSTEFTGAKGTCTAGGSEFDVEGSATKTYACNGGSGSGGGYPECLPSGKTEEGQFALFQTVTAENLGANIRTSISFSIPLCKGVTVTPIFVAVGEATPAHCTGGFNEPGAEKGYLCVFETLVEGLAFNTFQSAETEAPTAQGSGTLLVMKSIEENRNDRAAGDWAVTAP